MPEHKLPSIVRLWPDPNTGPWLVRLRFTNVQGRAECVGLELRSFREDNEPDSRTRAESPVHGASVKRLPTIEKATEPLTASRLRRLPIGALLDEARLFGANLKYPRETDSAPGWPDSVPRIAAGEAFAGTKRPGRPLQWTPERLAEVADVYIEALRNKKPPRKAVAERFHVTPPAAAKLVMKARAEGLLGQTRRGRSGP